MTSTLLLALLAASPQFDLPALWNQAFPEWTVDPKTLERPGHSDCKADDSKINVDEANLFVWYQGTYGPECDKATYEMTIFTRPGGASPWLLAAAHAGIDSGLSLLKGYQLKDGKAVELTTELDNLKPFALLPKELQRDSSRSSYAQQYMLAEYRLPRRGTTIEIDLEIGEIRRLCQALQPQPAACSEDGIKKMASVKMKWNAKEGRFEPTH
jgi:hypothetical protein